VVKWTNAVQIKLEPQTIQGFLQSVLKTIATNAYIIEILSFFGFLLISERKQDQITV